METYLGQLRSAILAISRGILRAISRLWEDFSGPWWGKYTLIPPADRPGVVVGAEGLAKINQVLAGDAFSGSVLDQITGLGLTRVSDLAAPSIGLSMLGEVTIQVVAEGQDPWFFKHRLTISLGMTSEEIRSKIESEIEHLKLKYGWTDVQAASSFSLLYQG